MSGPVHSPSPALRLRIIVVCVACLFGALFARLWFLQVIEGPSAHLVAADNGVRIIYTPAPRGLILDRTGKVLVGNREELVVDVDRQTAASQPRVLRTLAPLLGETTPRIQAALNDPQYSPYAPVPVRSDPTPDQVLQIQEHPSRFPGVTIGRQWVRSYTPAGVAAANIVGYVGRITAAQYKAMKSQGYRPSSMVGQTGIEASYQSVLRGRPGMREVEVDAQGNVLSTLKTIPPVPGENVRLSIDGTVQMAAVNALAQETAIKRTQLDSDGSGNYRASTGAVVVENPRNGRLLALATYPTYDPSLFAKGISEARYLRLTSPASHYPLDDRALGGQYFPGSTFKLVTATAGLESGVITPTSLFHDVGGGITVGGHFFANDGHQSYGFVALPFAITVSDDAYFYKIGETLYDHQSSYGPNLFQRVAYSYGFGRPTGIHLPGEASGYVLTPQLKAALHQRYPKAYPYGTYYTGDAIQSAIGEEDVAVTPLQLANAYSAFANGGTLYQPSLVLDAESTTGQVIRRYPVTEVGRSPALTPADRQAMVSGFVGVTSNPLGTAYGSFGKTRFPIQVAGKTGTAQVVSGIPHTSPGYKQPTSVFTSFAPASAPRYVVDCFIPQGGYGAEAAAPVVRQVYDVLFHQPILATPLSGY